MAIKDDTQLDAWRYQYPSTKVSWDLIPDPASCQQFIGEAKNMLYQLKNRMNIAIPKLKSLQDIRLNGGTTIIVKSIYGQDFIEISAGEGRGVGGKRKYSCTITFYNVPLYIPPMQNPGVIKTGEFQGVDYFKTYYSIDISKCPVCQKISWEFLFTYLQSSPLVPLPKPPLPISTRKEWPVEPMHHSVPDAIPPIDEPNNHTIYSMSPPAWGEVISHGTDSGGTYIIWKAYTETGQISRTGLGIMRLVARIRDDTGIEVCAQNERIEVDCCLKDIKNRTVEIWWEDFGTCQPYIMYGGVAICKMPTVVQTGGLTGLLMYSSYPAQPLYAIPDIKGSCLPVEWTLEGPIELWGSKKNDNLIYFHLIGGGCNEPVFIRLKDRCSDLLYEVMGSPCCGNEATLQISCISLLMYCGQSQTLTASGGCGPYLWSISAGGGTITPGSVIGDTAVYKTPDTNANCTNNPTITVTDCCGNSAQIKLAINCYTVSTAALSLDEATQDTCTWSGGVCQWTGSARYRDWNCDGTPIYDYPYSVNMGVLYDTDGSCTTWASSQDVCTTQCALGPHGRCPHSPRAAGWPAGAFWSLWDVRNQAMLDGGCCPLNPLTGLPYNP
jgi:hypothetical protein